MTDADLQVVIAAYEAFARGDIDAAVEHLASDVEWVEPDEFPNGGRYVGPDAVADYFRKSRAAWAELQSAPEAARQGDKIVVIHRVSGRLADGSPHENTVTDVFTLVNGKVTKMVAYADPGAVSAS